MSNRLTNIDLLKIIASFMVVLLHINLMFIFNYKANDYEGILLWILEFIALPSVNIFALVSGYVFYDKKFKWERLIEIWIIAFIYNFIFVLISEQKNFSSLDIHFIIKLFTPIITQNFWYVSSYFSLMFFIPILNLGIQNEDKKTFLIFAVLSLVFFSIISYYNKDIFNMANGSSLIWLMIMYIIGAGIHKFNIEKEIQKKWLILLYILSLIFMEIYFLLSHMRINNYNLDFFSDAKYLAHNNPIIFSSSILILLIFAKIKINNHFIIKIISFLSPLTLGIYMIHTSIVLILQKVFNINIQIILQNSNPIKLFIIIILFSIFIYLISAILDNIRKVIFDEVKKRIIKK
ncbi:MAG: acyltransferase [Eubacteriales bacterium]|nr:acyltransferase [Eubacteriales bacterium]